MMAIAPIARVSSLLSCFLIDSVNAREMSIDSWRGLQPILLTPWKGPNGQIVMGFKSYELTDFAIDFVVLNNITSFSAHKFDLFAIQIATSSSIVNFLFANIQQGSLDGEETEEEEVENQHPNNRTNNKKSSSKPSKPTANRRHSARKPGKQLRRKQDVPQADTIIMPRPQSDATKLKHARQQKKSLEDECEKLKAQVAALGGGKGPQPDNAGRRTRSSRGGDADDDQEGRTFLPTGQDDDDDGDEVQDSDFEDYGDDDDDDTDDDIEEPPKKRSKATKKSAGARQGGRPSSQSGANTSQSGPTAFEHGQVIALDDGQEAIMIAVTTKKKGRGRTRKHDKGKKSVDLDNLIHTTIKDHTWRINKAVLGPKSAKCLAKLVLMHFGWPSYEGQDPTTLAKVEKWVEENHETCASKLNYHRGYVQGRLKDICEKYRDTHQGTLPPLEMFEKCLQREIDPKKKEEMDFFLWYWEKFLPKACGNDNDWDKSKRHYATISKASPPNDPNHLYVTSSTEAMGVTLVKSCYQRWERMYHYYIMHNRQYALKTLTKNHKGEIEHNERVRFPTTLSFCPSSGLHCPQFCSYCPPILLLFAHYCTPLPLHLKVLCW